MLGGKIRSSKEKKREKGGKSGYLCVGQVRLSDGFVFLGDRGHARWVLIVKSNKLLHKHKQQQQHNQIIISSESLIKLRDVELAVSSEMFLWNRFKSVNHHECFFLFRDFPDIVFIFAVFTLFGNIWLISRIFRKVVSFPKYLVFPSVTSRLCHNDFFNLSEALKVVKGVFWKVNKI